MKRTIIIETLDEDTKDNLHSIVKAIDEIQKEDEVDIFVYSCGGDNWMFDILRVKLNKLVEQEYNITMRGLLLYSNGFNIFYDFKGNKIIENGCEALVHTQAISARIFNHLGTTKIRTTNITEKLRIQNTKPRQRDFLTIQEKEDFLNGGDIYLDEERLKEIFQMK